MSPPSLVNDDPRWPAQSSQTVKTIPLLLLWPQATDPFPRNPPVSTGLITVRGGHKARPGIGEVLAASFALFSAPREALVTLPRGLGVLAAPPPCSSPVNCSPVGVVLDARHKLLELKLQRKLAEEDQGPTGASLPRWTVLCFLTCFQISFCTLFLPGSKLLSLADAGGHLSATSAWRGAVGCSNGCHLCRCLQQHAKAPHVQALSQTLQMQLSAVWMCPLPTPSSAATCTKKMLIKSAKDQRAD